MEERRSATLFGSLALAGLLAACGGGAAAPSSSAPAAVSAKPSAAASAAASAKPSAAASAAAAASAKPAGSAGAAAASGSAAAKPAPSIVPATTKAMVKVTASSTLGNILTDDKGKTLYTYDDPTTPAGKDPSKCATACLGPWPPFLSTDAPDMPSGLTGKLAVITRSDIGANVKQVTFNDAPLYYFVQDTNPGDTKGQGSKGFGGNWMVVKAG